MKLPKKIAVLLTVALIIGNSFSNLGYVYAANGTLSETLVGEGRWETAIEISKKGWFSAKEAIIVNDNSIADALCATPFADAKNAPILLTNTKKLDERTKQELKRLGVTNVYLIGGESVLSKNIEEELKKENLNVDRIFGETREKTSLEIAKRLDSIKGISEIAVVDGYKGLADAVSIAAVASDKDMPIILSNSSEGTKATDEFIKSKNIKKSYVIGGASVVSDSIKDKLPSAIRIAGNDRNETNAKVIEYFYSDDKIKNAYVAKDGMTNQSNLIDALAVGVLAAKNDSPVILVGNKLNNTQKEVINTKSFDVITKVGGNGNEVAFNELKSIQDVTTYNVSTVEELNNAIAKSDANDVINMSSKTRVDIDKEITIKTNKALNINLSGNYKKTITVSAPNVKLVNMGSISKIVVKDCSKGSIENSKNAVIVSIEVSSTASKISFNNKGTVTNIKNDAKETSINNTGTITNKPTGSQNTLISGNKPGDNNTSGGSGSGSGGGNIDSNPSNPEVPKTNIASVSIKDNTPDATEVGEILEVEVRPANATVNYQWMICDSEGGVYTPITGANAKTYEVKNQDKNKFIKVKVTGTGNYVGEKISLATNQIKDLNDIVNVGSISDLKNELEKGSKNISIVSDMNINEPLVLNTQQKLIINKDVTVNVSNKLTVNGNITVNGKISTNKINEDTKYVNSNTENEDTSLIKVGGNGSIAVNQGSSMEFENFDDIITPSQQSLLLYEGANVKVGDKQYIGSEKSNAVIKLSNFEEESNNPVAGYYFNGDGELLLVIFEEAEVIKSDSEILDISLLVKAGDKNTRPGELVVPNFDIIKSYSNNQNGDKGINYNAGRIVIESNGTLVKNNEIIMSKDDSNSVFNAQGGDLDNRRGIVLSKMSNNELVLDVHGDVSMNKGFKDATICAEYRGYNTFYGSDLYPYLDIKFNPMSDGESLVKLNGIDTPEQAKYKIETIDENRWAKYCGVSEVDSIIGKDIYETAALIADKQAQYENVILISEDSKYEAMTASGLSGALNAPILMTKKDELPNSIKSRISSEMVKNVYIIGGEVTISKEIEDKIEALGKSVERIAGEDRYKTSYKVAKKVKSLSENLDKVILVNGVDGYADSMNICQVANRDKIPVILTDGNDIGFDIPTDIQSYVVGGEKFMSNTIVEKAKAERLAGNDRYETNRIIVSKFYKNLNDLYIVDTDSQFNMLMGSALAKNSPIVLVDKGSNKQMLKGVNKLTVLDSMSDEIKQECINATK